ncbi:SDR family oxidoreductase [Fictibacillus fluitans]|uniref:SDR family oxidoreductase n=1 Tax=Fictibacillus fluitans TaxID=3058422 RepID=A0ABT8HTB8_9BACL|nr:SDR family oxidoreductase [Fictibacillus sp. NE201]MDN4524016.1 SDR family oxidoreductase [Fictibacillus sp. NE201]
MVNIKDKVVVITGGSSGMGRTTAALLAERGAKVVVGARRKGQLKELVTAITSTGGSAIYQVTDVTIRSDVERLVKCAVESYGKVDVIINNAGVMPISPLDDLRVEDWEKMIDVNIKGVLYGIAAALPVFRKQGTGHFINIASTAGHKTVPSQSVYSATKYAVRALSEGLRQEAGDKLRVTIISPGMTLTSGAESITNPTAKDRLKELQKIAMPPEAIARAIAFAIEQPADIDVNEMIVRPTAQA